MGRDPKRCFNDRGHAAAGHRGGHQGLPGSRRSGDQLGLQRLHGVVVPGLGRAPPAGEEIALLGADRVRLQIHERHCHAHADVVAAWSGADLADEWKGSLPCAWIPTEDTNAPEHKPVAVDKARYAGDAVAVIALGAWTPHALPWLAAEFRSTGHPVFHLAPKEVDAFRPERFPVFCAEIQNTGYYGFPAHPESGVVKIARHGKGRPMHPESPQRSVTAEETAQLREFLAGTFPLLQDAPIVHTRICLYCDSPDGHFWIARDPDRPGLVVASGDSGHAFKFAPVMGPLIADVVKGRPGRSRFAWRPGLHPGRWEEATRSQT